MSRSIINLQRASKSAALAPAVLGLAVAFGAAQADELSDDALAVSDMLLAVSVISEDELGAHRGADSNINSHNMTTEALTTLTATNSGTITSETVTAGHISVADHALGNFSGMHNSVMNTGPLNNLMAGMSVTVVLAE